MLRIASIVGWAALVLLVCFFVAGYLALNVLHVPPHPGLTYAMFTAHWLATIGACVLALRWSFSSAQARFYLSLTLSFLAMASSYWGLKCIHISTTQIVNGRFQRQFDSQWFFTASVILATFALVFTLWKKGRLKRVT